MVNVLFASIFAVIVFSSWVAPANASSNSYTSPEGTARMLAADGIKAQWNAARQNCIEHGFPKGTSEFLVCFMEYQMQSLRALGARFKAITDVIARQHRLCIDRHRYEMARCTDI